MSKPVLVAITSDHHAGSVIGLCPSEGVRLDEGGEYRPNKAQLWLWQNWLAYHEAIAIRPLPAGSRKGAYYVGETQIDERGQVRCIVLDERFALANPWSDITKALLHEIVHVWQAASGQRDTHGESFKRMAQRLGINPGWTVD